ncbi:MAG: hypothetical protein II595_08085 [Desulfovibrio sp.]|nr:hypothetical protein [Desulfovibrio sp.]
MRLFSGTGRGRARWLRHEDQGGIGLRAIRAGGAEIVQPVVVASVLPL